MRLLRIASPLAAMTLVSLVGVGSARADLPPPPGTTRVDYTFRVEGTPRDVVLVAFPMYRSEGGQVVELAPGKDFRPVQGYTPGIYSVPASALPTLVGNKDDDAVRQTLESKGHACVKKVPRVFTVPTKTKVSSMVDVFQIEASTTGCKATLSKTLYAGADGAKGEGGADASGKRTPPAPFGADLPPIGDISAQPSAAPGPSAASSGTAAGATAPITTAPRSGDGAPASRGGCAGCVIAPRRDGRGPWVFAAAAALLAAPIARPGGRHGACRRRDEMLPQLAGAPRASRSCAPSVFPKFGLRPNGEDGRPHESVASALARAERTSGTSARRSGRAPLVGARSAPRRALA